MAAGESYDEFVEKFKPKRTTDDCYTPPEVYEAVLRWVKTEYRIGGDVPIVRPFRPGGDYQAEIYPDGCVVVDNPPFSILSQIRRWYMEHGVRFFLFAPALTLFGQRQEGVTCVAADLDVTYHNGAQVCTGFITSLEPGVAARTAPSLTASVQEVCDRVAKAGKRHVPKYTYPPELLTAARLGWIGVHGVELKIPEARCVRVSELDAQRDNPQGKGVFGSGLLLSESMTVERAAAERAAATVWPLSKRERRIVAGLDDPPPALFD